MNDVSNNDTSGVDHPIDDYLHVPIPEFKNQLDSLDKSPERWLNPTNTSFNYDRLTLSQSELDQLVGVHDKLTKAEADLFYTPLCHFILKQYQTKLDQLNIKSPNRATLKEQSGERTPACFVIFITGGVAVGKSTTARVIQAILKRALNEVELVTTDNFIKPNRILEASGLMKKKGFPESYETKKLISFLREVRCQEKEKIVTPVYSHEKYDILPDQYQSVGHPKILVVEGLNLLQTLVEPIDGARQFTQYADLTLYVDANPEDIRRWYVERFFKFRNTTFKEPGNRWNEYANLNDEETKSVALSIYDEINGPNLIDHIHPTRTRADFILFKNASHKITGIHMKNQ